MNKKIHLKKNDESLTGAFNSVERVNPSSDFHQLEFVSDFKGLAYVNDAKSIRITATRYSLEAIETSVVLIIGGDDDNVDYSVLSRQIKTKVVAIIYLGVNSNNILKHYSDLDLIFYKAQSLEEAVEAATKIGQSGDVVLFSPACSNKDENYMKRGNDFKNLVKQLSA